MHAAAACMCVAAAAAVGQTFALYSRARETDRIREEEEKQEEEKHTVHQSSSRRHLKFRGDWRGRARGGSESKRKKERENVCE